VTPEERSSLVARYRGGHAAFAAVLDGVTVTELDARPFEGEWTVREIVHHLADGELSSAVRLRRLVAEDQPAIAGYDEGLYARRLYYDVRPIDASLEVVRAARAASATILDHLSDEEWTRAGTHSEMGAYGVEVWLRVYAGHPYEHAEQARAVLKAVREARA
jgi:radical SAM superfamily enzyme YgiQ (UPF0313 family)